MSVCENDRERLTTITTRFLEPDWELEEVLGQEGADTVPEVRPMHKNKLVEIKGTVHKILPFDIWLTSTSLVSE